SVHVRLLLALSVSKDEQQQLTCRIDTGKPGKQSQEDLLYRDT
ncbi:hypothetical protein GBF38_015613, partial [Nibea albiflora]